MFAINLRGTGGDEFIIFKGGRVKIGPGSSTVFDLSPTGNLEIQGVLTENSDVRSKTNITAVDPFEVLFLLRNLPISTWAYLADLSSIHMGPMAQEFYAAFGLGYDGTGIASLDTSGVALAAIQALAAENEALKAQNAEFEQRLAELEAIVAGLSNS